jgi:hypothetical protein
VVEELLVLLAFDQLIVGASRPDGLADAGARLAAAPSDEVTPQRDDSPRVASRLGHHDELDVSRRVTQGAPETGDLLGVHGHQYRGSGRDGVGDEGDAPGEEVIAPAIEDGLVHVGHDSVGRGKGRDTARYP